MQRLNMCAAQSKWVFLIWCSYELYFYKNRKKHRWFTEPHKDFLLSGLPVSTVTRAWILKHFWGDESRSSITCEMSTAVSPPPPTLHGRRCAVGGSWSGRVNWDLVFTQSAFDTWTGLISLPTVDCIVHAHPQALSSDPFSLGDRRTFGSDFSLLFPEQH